LALADAAGKTPRALKAIEAMFADADAGVRNNAHVAHFKVTEDLGVYVPHLLRITATADKNDPLLTDEQKAMRHLLSLSGGMRIYDLTRLRPDELSQELSAHLSHKEPRIQQCALRQLRALCITSKSSYRAVERLKLRDKLATMEAEEKDEETRRCATLALTALTEGPPETAPEVAKPLD
jgi:hypothetical protein